jgi:putative transcriptional regulator
MRLRELRHIKGLTLKQVAQKAKVSESAMSLYERGKRNPNLVTAYRIAKALGVTVDELIGKKAG